MHSGFYGDVGGFSLAAPANFFSLSPPLTLIMIPGETLDANYMPHDDTIDFLETSRPLRGHPCDSPPLYPAGGLIQTTPDSPLWTQLAFTRAHQALWRRFAPCCPGSSEPSFG